MTLDPNDLDALVQAAKDRNVPLIDAKAIVRAYLVAASPSPPALDGAGRDAVIEECAKVAENCIVEGHHWRRDIATAIRSLKETP